MAENWKKRRFPHSIAEGVILFFPPWNFQASQVRWKRKWFLLPDSTAEPRGLNVHAHEEQGSLKNFNYTEDFPYTLLDRQLMCFRVFKMLTSWWLKFVSDKNDLTSYSLGLCRVLLLQNCTENCQKGSPCKEPYKKKKSWNSSVVVLWMILLSNFSAGFNYFYYLNVLNKTPPHFSLFYISMRRGGLI